jgi:hypothetical protein
MNMYFGMNSGKKIPNQRRTRTEGHLAQLIRRKMIQKSHSENKFDRNKIKHEDRKGPHYIVVL